MKKLIRLLIPTKPVNTLRRAIHLSLCTRIAQDVNKDGARVVSRHTLPKEDKLLRANILFKMFTIKNVSTAIVFKIKLKLYNYANTKA